MAMGLTSGIHAILAIHGSLVDHVVMMTLVRGSISSFSLHMFELLTLGSLGYFLLPLVSMYFLRKHSNLSLTTVLLIAIGMPLYSQCLGVN